MKRFLRSPANPLAWVVVAAGVVAWIIVVPLMELYRLCASAVRSALGSEPRREALEDVDIDPRAIVDVAEASSEAGAHEAARRAS